MLECCFLSSVQGLGSKRATINQHSSRSCKTVACQSWRSKKDLFSPRALLDLFSKKGLNLPRARIFFRHPILTGLSFAVSWATIMYSSSFESNKLYLFRHYFNKTENAVFTPKLPALHIRFNGWKIIYEPAEI